MRRADFWPHVERRGEDECWPWLASKSSNGYGVLRLEGRMERAHRVAYAFAVGDPGDLHVLHRCDNPPCCNPAHLFVGTYADNNRDCRQKRRNRFGESHHSAKLTAPKVQAIRQLSAAGALGTELAAHFGVTPQTISYVVRRQIWRHT